MVGHDQTKPSDCVSGSNFFCDWFGNECCTVCPGEALAETIKTWPQYVKFNLLQSKYLIE